MSEKLYSVTPEETGKQYEWDLWLGDEEVADIYCADSKLVASIPAALNAAEENKRLLALLDKMADFVRAEAFLNDSQSTKYDAADLLAEYQLTKGESDE